MFITLLFITGCSDNSTIRKEQQPEIHKNNQETTIGHEQEQRENQPTKQPETSDASPKITKEKQTSNRFSVPLLYVIDGDTIKVKINGKEESVRFLLVDTPETHHPRLGVQPFGPEASNFTKKLLSHSTVLLEKDISERDKYGRLLMYVYTPDGQSVQEELLRQGLARVAYVYAPNTKYVDKYTKIQKDAQKRGVGIWSVENYAQEDGYHPNVMDYNEIKQPTQQPKSSSDGGAFPPDANGNCGGQIKGNQGSNGWIYHIPSGRYYKVTKAEQCFRNEQDAEQAGYRKSSS